MDIIAVANTKLGERLSFNIKSESKDYLLNLRMNDIIGIAKTIEENSDECSNISIFDLEKHKTIYVHSNFELS